MSEQPTEPDVSIPYDLNIKEAQRAHDSEKEFWLRTNDATINAGNLALRALLIINGGAAIALLAFIGNFVPVLPGEYAGLPKIHPSITPMMWFALGVFASVMAMVFAYCTNYLYITAAGERICNFKHPYVHDTDKFEMWRNIGIVTHFITVALAVLSIIIFILGIYEVNEMINTFLKVPQSN